MEVASLGVEINSNGVLTAEERLKRFQAAGVGAETVVGSLARAAIRAGGALAGAFGLSALARYADQWSDLQSQVGAAIKDMDAAAGLMSRLGNMARASYSPLEQTVNTYARNAGVLRDLGKSADQAADFTEALNNALVITATRGERAASVQNALSKAMATGKLQADGLETVLANGGRVAEALADELGTTVSGLRGLASQGKVTGGVIANALIGSLENLRAEAAEMPATLADAGTIWRNTITEIVGRMDQATNASGGLAEKLIDMADAVRAGADGFIQFALVVSENFERMVYWGGAYVTMMGVNYVAAVGAAAVATDIMAIALRGLRLAIAGTGIGVLAIILGDVALKLWEAATATDGLADSIESAAAPANSFFSFMKNGAEALAATFDWLTSGIAAGFVGAFATVYEWYAKLVNAIRTGAEKLGIADKIGMTPGAGMDETWATSLYLKLSNQASAAGDLAAKRWAATFGARVPELVDVDGIVGALATKTYDSVDDMWAGMRGTAASPTTSPLSKEALKAQKNYAELVRGAQQFIAAQTLEQQALGMTAEAAARMRHEQQLLAQAANDNIKLTPAMRQELVGLAAEMAAVEERTRSLTEWYNFGKTTLGSFFSDFKRDLMAGTSLWESFGNAAANALDSIADRALSMAANGLFDMIFGAFMGGIGGINPFSLGAGGPGFLGGGAGAWGPSFAGGGYTGYGPRTGGLDGMGGFPAILHPNETVIDHTRPYAANQNQANDNAPRITINNYGTPQRYEVQSVSRDEIVLIARDEAANAVEQYNDGMPGRIRDVGGNRWKGYTS